MAFTGSPTFYEVSDRVIRVTGLSLAAGATGVIGLFGGAAEISLPDGFKPTPYRDIDLAESVEVSFNSDANPAAAVFPSVSIRKQASPFQASFVNGGGAPSGSIEIWMRFH